MDEASFAQVKPVYGLVFLFKWTGEKDERATVDASSRPGLFFARQVRDTISTKTLFREERYGRELVHKLKQDHTSVPYSKKTLQFAVMSCCFFPPLLF